MLPHPQGVEYSREELPVATCVMQNSSKELSTLVAVKPLFTFNEQIIQMHKIPSLILRLPRALRLDIRLA